MNSNTGYCKFYSGKKMPEIRDKFTGSKRMQRQNYRLGTGNRLRLSKTKIKRDLARGCNAFKSMQIIATGK